MSPKDSLWKPVGNVRRTKNLRPTSKALPERAQVHVRIAFISHRRGQHPNYLVTRVWRFPESVLPMDQVVTRFCKRFHLTLPDMDALHDQLAKARAYVAEHSADAQYLARLLKGAPPRAKR